MSSLHSRNYKQLHRVKDAMPTVKRVALHPFSWLLLFELITSSMPRLSALVNTRVGNHMVGSFPSAYAWDPCSAGKLAHEIGVLQRFYAESCGSCGIVSGFYAPGAFLAWLVTILTVLHKYQSLLFRRLEEQSRGQSALKHQELGLKGFLDPIIAAVGYPMIASIDLVIRSCRRDVGVPLIAANKVTCISWFLASYRLHLETYIPPTKDPRNRQSRELLLWKMLFIANSLAFFLHGIVAKSRGRVPIWLVLQSLWSIPCLYILIGSRSHGRTVRQGRLLLLTIAMSVLYLLDQQVTSSNCYAHESDWMLKCTMMPDSFREKNCKQVPNSKYPPGKSVHDDLTIVRMNGAVWECPSTEEFPGISECFRLARYKWSCQDMRYGFLPCSNSTLGEMDQIAALGLVVFTMWILPFIRMGKKRWWHEQNIGPMNGAIDGGDESMELEELGTGLDEEPGERPRREGSRQI
jgi:hypothetical protein